jgi:hypothetical protein
MYARNNKKLFTRYSQEAGLSARDGQAICWVSLTPCFRSFWASVSDLASA